MIKLGIIIEHDKIITDYSDNEIKLSEVSLMIYEIEKIKRKLLNIKFKNDFEIKQ